MCESGRRRGFVDFIVDKSMENKHKTTDKETTNKEKYQERKKKKMQKIFDKFNTLPEEEKRKYIFQ